MVDVLADPSIWADAYSVSVAQQSVVDFTLEAGAPYAGRSYVVLGSITGMEPGFNLPGGTHVALNWDLFTSFILANLTLPVFTNFMGTLDGTGASTATFDTLGPMDPALVGLSFHFGYILSPPPGWDFASNVIEVTIEN